jgi:hypothetical protein
MRKLFSLVFVAGCALAETLPNPDAVRMVQERSARESAVAHQMARVAEGLKPKAAPVKKPHMKVCIIHCGPSKELRNAVKEYIKTDHPMPIFWEPKQ